MVECNGEEPLVSLPEDVDLVTGSFVNAQGLKLQTYRFSPGGAATRRGIVWLCHGCGAHTFFDWLLPESPGRVHDRWEGSILQRLVSAGYCACALDHQGHGRSEGARGLRCFFESFDDFPNEALAYLVDVMLKEEWARGLPVFLFGSSMGGAVAVRMAQQMPELFKGLVLYGPMLSLEAMKQQRLFACIRNGHLNFVITALDHVIPSVALIEAPRNVAFPEWQTEFDVDPLNYHGNIYVRMAKEFGRVTDGFMQGGLKSLRTPCVTFHAVRDTLTDPFGSEQLLKMADCADKAYLKVGVGQDVDVDIWHALNSEQGFEVVFQRALKWIEERAS